MKYEMRNDTFPVDTFTAELHFSKHGENFGNHIYQDIDKQTFLQENSSK